MTQTPHPNPQQLAEFRWMDNGQSVLWGGLLDYFHRLDRLFLSWAEDWQAEAYGFPTFILASALSKLDYFQNFPHLITIPVVLDADPDNLQAFANEPCGCDGSLALPRLEPVQDVLTPAACYHFYLNLEGQTLAAPRYLTTRASCFRRETHYLPLQRQWSFSMREIVCIGTAQEVQDFLGRMQETVQGFFQEIDLPIRWENATDPFFNPSKNPKFLMQKLEPVKTEMISETDLAIGSVNFHRNYFGDAFRIQRDGQEAFSGCVAFGLERWLYAFFVRYGKDLAQWPALNTGGAL